MQRVILHVDLDSFYASVEELRNKEIKGKPVVICVFSGRSADSGAVSTANYKARELGIRAGMPIVFARRLAKDKDVAFLPMDIEYYRTVSERIMTILEEECDAIQQVSIDEAYLDVTVRSGGRWEEALKMAEEIKRRINEEEGLTCSIGMGPNKLVAKMASSFKKPDGLTIVREMQVQKFFENLSLSDIHGIGSKTAEALDELGIRTTKELASVDVKILEATFGKNKARLLQDKAQGIDASSVEQTEPQQISRIGTLKEDTDSLETILQKISELAADMKVKIEKKKVTFRTISIITIDTTLKAQTKSETLQQTDDLKTILRVARSLFEMFFEENPEKKLRRVGIRVSNLMRKEGREIPGSLDKFLN
jgi:DNA polymerase IV (DinB-like DNA polymerase)